MLLRCCIIILLFLKTVSSNEINENITKTSTVSSSKNNAIPYEQLEMESKRTNIKRISLNVTDNPTSNIEKITGTGRFLRKYEVVTCDGYILTVIRLTPVNDEQNDYPVLLVHGLFQSSDIFIDQNEEQSLVFKLHDLGFDVWLANVRGNRYSRQHIYLEPETDEKDEFFDYDYEEIATYDIAATVDYIINETNKEKLHYIGHSLGGTVFLVLNSLKPVYNDKFVTAHLFAPIGYQNHFSNRYLATEASRYKEIYKNAFDEMLRRWNEAFDETFFDKMIDTHFWVDLQAALSKQGTAEIFPDKPTALQTKEKKFPEENCLGNKTYEIVCCELEIYEIMGLNNNKNDKDHTRGGSIKQLAHLAQNIKSKTFSRWDYGETENINKYGTKEPPKYNLSLVTVKTKIFYTPNDEYVKSEDIVNMANDMGNAETMKVERSYFKHKDFIVGPDVMDTVYRHIIEDYKETWKLKPTKSVAVPMEFPWKILLISGVGVFLLCIAIIVVRKYT